MKLPVASSSAFEADLAKINDLLSTETGTVLKAME